MEMEGKTRKQKWNEKGESREMKKKSKEKGRWDMTNLLFSFHLLS